MQSHPATAGLPNRLGLNHENSFDSATYSSINPRGSLPNERDHRQVSQMRSYFHSDGYENEAEQMSRQNRAL